MPETPTPRRRLRPRSGARGTWLGYSLSALAILSLCSTSAFAQGSAPKLYVTDFVGYQGQVKALIVEQITKVVRQRLDADPTVAVLPQLSEGDVGAGLSPAIIEAMRLYESGRGQYVNQMFPDAASNFSAALEYFETNIADIEDWEVVEAVLFRLSAASFQNGDTERSKELVGRLLMFNPEFAVSADEELPEGYHKQFAAAQKARKKRGKGKLDTSAVTPGAEIWLDGKLRGATPMSIEDVPAGTHFLALKTSTGRYGTLVTVEKKQTAKVTAKLEAAAAGGTPEAGLLAALQDGDVADDVRFAARDLANRSASGFMVTGIIVPVSDGFVLQTLLYTPETATLRSLEPITFDSELLSVNVDGYKVSRSVIDAIFDPAKGEVVSGTVTFDPAAFGGGGSTTDAVAIIDPNITGDGGDGSTGAETGTGTGQDTTTGSNGDGDPEIITGFEPVDDDSWYENPWIWTGIGVGVAGAAVLTVFLLSDTGGADATGFNATVEW